MKVATTVLRQSSLYLESSANEFHIHVNDPKSNESVIALNTSRSNKSVIARHTSRSNNTSRSHEPVFGQRSVTGSSKKQGERFGFLQPHDHLVVPNIAHFILFSCHPFVFENLISMLSAHRVMKADTILFHTDCQPEGEWWQEAKDLIPTLIIHNMTMPTEVFGKNLSTKWLEHAADVARLQILMQWGGVYFDLDVFVLASLDPLRYYNYVVGRASVIALANGIILANKNAKFLKIFYNSYKNYISSCWGCSSVIKQNELAKEYRNLLHIEPDSMIRLKYREKNDIFIGKYNWWEQHFTVHVYMRRYWSVNRNAPPFTKENIKTSDNAFGEMCRYIYYGSPALIYSNATKSKVP
ncbi:uncharacterized protein LOC144439828 [Glandiceps talaboti]